MHPLFLGYPHAIFPQLAEESLLIKIPPCLYILAVEVQHMSFIFMDLKPF